MTANQAFILWDSSHLWGLMTWRTLRSFGLACRLVKAIEISQGNILRKPDPPATQGNRMNTSNLLKILDILK